jgi:hypothetical protein
VCVYMSECSYEYKYLHLYYISKINIIYFFEDMPISLRGRGVQPKHTQQQVSWATKSVNPKENKDQMRPAD